MADEKQCEVVHKESVYEEMVSEHTAGDKASSKETTQEDLCQVCFEHITFYAVGVCDHPICIKCSTLMRVIRGERYCVMCRSNMPKVVFTSKIQEFKDINTQTFTIHKKYQIYFENRLSREEFMKLKAHKCSICTKPTSFPFFNQYKKHMLEVDDLVPCQLCLDHVKVFSSERKFYTSQQLDDHCLNGDKDDRSYKGHPSCEFCDIHYFDKDELIRHLRKDHFFCHFCEKVGKIGEYFPDNTTMKEHFREVHFLCEQRECSQEQFFTNAYETIETYNNHCAAVHSSNKKRGKKLPAAGFRTKGKKSFPPQPTNPTPAPERSITTSSEHGRPKPTAMQTSPSPPRQQQSPIASGVSPSPPKPGTSRSPSQDPGLSQQVSPPGTQASQFPPKQHEPSGKWKKRLVYKPQENFTALAAPSHRLSANANSTSDSASSEDEPPQNPMPIALSLKGIGEYLSKPKAERTPQNPMSTASSLRGTSEQLVRPIAETTSTLPMSTASSLRGTNKKLLKPTAESTSTLPKPPSSVPVPTLNSISKMLISSTSNNTTDAPSKTETSHTSTETASALAPPSSRPSASQAAPQPAQGRKKKTKFRKLVM